MRSPLGLGTAVVAALAAAGVARLSGDLARLADALAGQVFTEDVLGQWTAAYATGTAALEFVRGRALLWLEVQLVLASIDAARGDEARCRERCERIRRLGGQANSPSSVVLADRREALLDLGRQPEATDELDELGLPDPTPAGELLEPLVGLLHPGHALGAERPHRRLDRLAEDEATVRDLIEQDPTFAELCQEYRQTEEELQRLRQRHEQVEEELLARIEGYRPT